MCWHCCAAVWSRVAHTPKGTVRWASSGPPNKGHLKKKILFGIVCSLNLTVLPNKWAWGPSQTNWECFWDKTFSRYWHKAGKLLLQPAGHTSSGCRLLLEPGSGSFCLGALGSFYQVSRLGWNETEHHWNELNASFPSMKLDVTSLVLSGSISRVCFWSDLKLPTLSGPDTFKRLEMLGFQLSSLGLTPHLF